MTLSATLPPWLSQQRENAKAATLPQWLGDWQEANWQAFINAGLPTKKNERYKYTDFAFLTAYPFATTFLRKDIDLYDAIYQHRLRHTDSVLLVFVNGCYDAVLSDAHKLPTGVIACSLKEAIEQHEALLKPHLTAMQEAATYPFAALNAALCTDGLFFYLPENQVLTMPVHVLSFSLGEEIFVANPHRVFVMGAHSKMQLLDEYVGYREQAYFNNITSTIALMDGASLNYYKIQSEGKNASHLSQTFVTQLANSESRFHHFSQGGLFARDDLQIKLQAAGAATFTDGLYTVNQPQQYIDHHVDIHHLAPRSQSEMLYKGTIDHRARAVFNGRLYVAKDAQKILAYQANHNLLLSNDAEVYSKPELEIYADDVKCKHGATIGQLNRAALFYLRARGIPEEEAMRILLEGFAEEVISRIDNASIKTRVQEALL